MWLQQRAIHCYLTHCQCWCPCAQPSLSVVGPNGHMRFSGDLNLTHLGNVPGWDGMWWLLAPVAQSNGATVEFDVSLTQWWAFMDL